MCGNKHANPYNAKNVSEKKKANSILKRIFHEKKSTKELEPGFASLKTIQDLN